MATRAATITYPGSSILVVWSGLLNTDTGVGVALPDYPDKSVQVTGTAGTGGAVTMEGSNDGGTTWSTLHEPDGSTPAVLTTDELVLLAEHTLLVRPSVTAGDGATNLQVRLSGAKNL